MVYTESVRGHMNELEKDGSLFRAQGYDVILHHHRYVIQYRKVWDMANPQSLECYICGYENNNLYMCLYYMLMFIYDMDL